MDDKEVRDNDVEEEFVETIGEVVISLSEELQTILNSEPISCVGIYVHGCWTSTG